MGNLAYIEELGISGDQANNDTEVEANDTVEESSEDLSLDSEDNSETNVETKANTESISELEAALKKQIEGMEKRIADKDAYINELREASKQKEAEQSQQGDTESDDDDFWVDPKAKYKSLEQQMALQQLQIQETIYANTVENYWKTVNPEALKNAVATDPDFASEFNGSSEPYKVAYEYLTNKAETVSKEHNALKEQLRAEIMKEMGIKTAEKKEVPPTINSSGGKSQSQVVSNAPDDGFASVFGSQY